ncbi:MAG: NfeD family protein [Acutalibacteraceae bacterium]
MDMIWVWLGIIVVACFLECATAVQLVSIWAALGGLVALIACLCGIPTEIQIILFFVVTVIALVLTRPLVKKFLKSNDIPTNADMCIGQVGKVISRIQGKNVRGQVRVLGTTWTAVSESDVLIPEGSEVRIQRIEGVKLIVEPI